MHHYNFYIACSKNGESEYHLMHHYNYHLLGLDTSQTCKTTEAREKFASLKKSTRDDVVAELEEDLHNSKSAFERSRFNLVNALMNIEAKKKYEFLESFSAIMDAQLRYFKLGYELLSQLEPFIHQEMTSAMPLGQKVI
ncbi:ARF-GAP domain 2 [Actinidia rufa]|uniref:ARF-GAP domain 2 n=1 Tax=Actinidia rufa TaxID=165716 RepID=A0A7J0GYM0_9ERIC|nr:ARF-GAP domain 2 [Actinidia rufa]